MRTALEEFHTPARHFISERFAHCATRRIFTELYLRNAAGDILVHFIEAAWV